MTPLNIVCLQRAGETYVFQFDDWNRSGAVDTAARWARDETLIFSQHDARLVLSRVLSLPILEGAGE